MALVQNSPVYNLYILKRMTKIIHFVWLKANNYFQQNLTNTIIIVVILRQR